MKEEFKHIPDFPGYLISRSGRVVSVKSGQPVELKSRISSFGYVSVTLTDIDGNRTQLGIHRLLAFAWLNDDGYLRTEVNHIDGNKMNNDLSNLEWVTHSENEIHKVENRMTELAKHVKLVNVETGETLYFPSMRAVSRFFNVSDSVIPERMREYNNGPYRGYLISYDD